MIRGYETHDPMLTDALSHASYTRRLLARPDTGHNNLRREFAVRLSEQGYLSAAVYFSAKDNIKTIEDCRFTKYHSRGKDTFSNDPNHFNLVCGLLELAAAHIDCISPSWQIGAGGQGHIIFDVSTVPFQFKFKVDVNVTSTETIFEEDTTP